MEHLLSTVLWKLKGNTNEAIFDHVEPEREISHTQGKKGKYITILSIF